MYFSYWDLRWANQSPSLVFNERSQLLHAIRRSMWNEGYTNEAQSYDPNRGTTNAGSTRTNFCVKHCLEGGMTANKRRTLVFWIAAATLTSDAAITIARCSAMRGVEQGGFVIFAFSLVLQQLAVPECPEARNISTTNAVSPLLVCPKC